MTLTQDNQGLAVSGPNAEMGCKGPLVLNETPFMGSLLSRDPVTGCLHRLVGGEQFAGICLVRGPQTKDWAFQGATNGSLYCQYARGRGEITIDNGSITFTQADAVNRRKVYATDENTFVLAPTTGTVVSNATYIGQIFEFITSTVGRIEFTTDEKLFSEPFARGVETLAAGSQTLLNRMANKLLYTLGGSIQTLTLPAMASWIGQYFSIVNGAGGAVVTIGANSGDGSVINGSATLAQTASTAGKMTILTTDGTKIYVVQNT